MSLWVSLNTAFTGLRATQAGVQLASQNVANAQTDGYTKKSAQYTQLDFGGVSMPKIERQVSEQLFRQSLQETSRLSKLETADDFLSQVVSFLGTPSSGGGRLSTSLSQLAAAIDTVATVPNQPNNLISVRDKVQALTDEFQSLTGQIQDLRLRADQEIATAIGEINDAVGEIDQLNKEIGRLAAVGQPIGDLQDQRDLTVQKLAEFMPVRVVSKPDGTSSVYMSDGRVLVDATARRFSEYGATGIVAAGDEWQMESGVANPGAFGKITFADAATEDSTFRFTEGKLGQLLTLRDGELPQMQAQLDNLGAKLRDEVNRVHNQGAVLPPQADMVGTRLFGSASGWAAGSDIGLSISAPGNQFLFAAVDANGNAVTSLPILTGGIATVDDLVTAINTAGIGASANFANGQLTVTPPPGGSFTIVGDGDITVTANSLGGVAVPGAQQEAVQGISNFFGLNDLMVSTRSGTSVTTDTWRVPTQKLSNFRLDVLSPAGAVAPYDSGAAPRPMEDIADEINTVYGGLVTAAVYRSGDGYAMRITGPNGAIISSTTYRVTKTEPGVAETLAIRSDIAQDPSRISRGRVVADATLGTYTLNSGDGSVMARMAQVFTSTLSFDKAGGLPTMRQNLGGYLSEIVGSAAAKASSAATSALNQKSVSDALHAKISEVSGVNVDEEMTQLMKLQNSYAASAKVMTTVQEMLDTLMSIGR